MGYRTVYLAMLPEIAGRTPANPFFDGPNGQVCRVGWFVGFTDEETRLPGAFQPGYLYSDTDNRIAERSLPGIMNLSDFNLFGTGERLLPFAALYTDNEVPGTLLWQDYDSPVDDSLCFDMSQTPQSIVFCHAMKAAKAVGSYEHGKVDELQYDEFITPVADSIQEFLMMLRPHP